MKQASGDFHDYWMSVRKQNGRCILMSVILYWGGGQITEMNRVCRWRSVDGIVVFLFIFDKWCVKNIKAWESCYVPDLQELAENPRATAVRRLYKASSGRYEPALWSLKKKHAVQFHVCSETIYLISIVMYKRVCGRKHTCSLWSGALHESSLLPAHRKYTQESRK